MRAGRCGSFEMVGETQTTSSRLGKLPVASRDEFKQDAKRNFSEEIKGAFSFSPQTDKDYLCSGANYG